MANQEQLEILKKNINLWNQWRENEQSEIIDLNGAYLNGANLRGANLSNAELSDADLSEADLRSAYLIGTYLVNTNLRGANLKGANLRDANLRDANLRDTNLNPIQLQMAKNVNPIYIKNFDSDSSRKIEEELEKAKKELEKANAEGKASAEETAKSQKIINELQSKIDQFEESQTKFISKLDEATKTITDPYKYLDTEIKHENYLYWGFITIALITFIFGTIYWSFYGISYQEKINWVCADLSFNIYKLFFIVSPILFFLGLSSTFLGLAFKRRQNIRLLEGKRQEIQHITKVISAYTLIDDDTNLKNARAFANEAFKQYLNKIIGLKHEKETEEKVDILSNIQDLKAQILELKKG